MTDESNNPCADGEPDDPASDDEEDEVDEDQDTMEVELDKNELLKPQPGEVIGETFLLAHYTDSTSAGLRKKRVR